MQLAETSWTDALLNIGSKYLDYKTQKTQSQAATKIVQAQNPYANYSPSYLPSIPNVPVSDNTLMYVAIGGAALIAVMLLGGKK